MKSKYGVKYTGNENEYRRNQSYEARRKDPLRTLFNTAKYRAKKRNLEFTITYEDLVKPKYCPVFGFELKTTEGRRANDSYSIDRVDNSKGYVKGNVRVISWKANQYKGNMSLQEVEQLLKYMKGES